MDWHQIAALVTGVLTISAVLPYVRDMLQGTTRPNLVTWGLWLIIQTIFILAQFSSGASWSVVLPLAEMGTVGVVFILGLFGYGYKKYVLLDIVCLVTALAAIMLWQLTSQPLAALLLSVVADMVASIPTLRKAYLDPRSETPSAYLLVVVSAACAGLSTTALDLPNLLWPVYIFILNGSVLALILLGRRHLGNRAKKALYIGP
ncbi:MAG TPA: hypothetical protein VG753_01910 [Candidatus Paceibacterota bacterium]|nr:hypothetical protein [Candidatus Paceibacterota bacterium]